MTPQKAGSCAVYICIQLQNGEVHVYSAFVAGSWKESA